MSGTYSVADPDLCRSLWETHVSQEQVSDLWDVRWCFQQHYQHRPHFIVSEDRRGVCGLLPLSWNSEAGVFTFFPGETWHAKTWLEQNRVIAADDRVLRRLLGAIPGPYHLRYLKPLGGVDIAGATVDEIGYLFLPPKYGYSLEAYFGEFSHKSAKKLRRELAAFEERGVTYRVNHLPDFETMIDLNLGRYGADSYFDDARFRASFASLLSLLAERGWLRLTAVMVGGEVAAVDMGCLFNGSYTLLAGGTSAAFPGIAKLINLHHMQYACEQRAERVDFLCGDFNWKTTFHLTPRPLYLLAGAGRAVEESTVAGQRLLPHAPQPAPGMLHA